jgi:predicted RNase H-like HicB family nuclease
MRAFAASGTPNYAGGGSSQDVDYRRPSKSKNMKFALAIQKDEAAAYGVIVPDLPGCHSWGQSIGHAIENAREAIESHLALLMEYDEESALSETPIDVLRHQPAYAGVAWRVLDVHVPTPSRRR